MSHWPSPWGPAPFPCRGGSLVSHQKLAVSATAPTPACTASAAQNKSTLVFVSDHLSIASPLFLFGDPTFAPETQWPHLDGELSVL